MPQMSQVEGACNWHADCISRELHVNFSTVSCLQHRFRELCSMSNHPHNRRPRVWAGRNYKQRTQLRFRDGNLNAQRYHDEILRPIVMWIIHRHHLMFQHENAWPCRKDLYTITGSWTCPSSSTLQTCHPLSMFGMLWIDVYNCVLQFLPISNNLAQLLKCGTTFHRPQSTKKRRCDALHEANGGHPRYWLVFWSTFLPFFKGIGDKQMHICIPSHVKSID